MHPLTLLALGLYGETLPNQNGAPVWVVVPREVRLQEWQIHREYPLRGNSPDDHTDACRTARIRPPFQRQSGSGASSLQPGQGAADRRIFQAQDLMFNGYAEQVAHLHRRMDLRKHF
jgi:methionine sulfoxide reductase catalytic subunit